MTEKAIDPGYYQRSVGEQEISYAIGTLQRYKQGKAVLENRVIEDEQWYRLRHDAILRSKSKKEQDRLQPTSAWLFDMLNQKHADAMDNYPVPAVLPREPSDEQSAQILSDILLVGQAEKRVRGLWRVLGSESGERAGGYLHQTH